MKSLQNIVVGVLGLLTLVLIAQAAMPDMYKPQEKKAVVGAPCVGEPIVVDYAFNGGYLEPWACQPQCDDNKQRYVLYTNGKATQCDTPPSCNDRGEDDGVTCTLPDIKS